MRVTEIERIKRVGQGVMNLLWLWKDVEESNTPHTQTPHNGAPKFVSGFYRPGRPT